MSTKKHTIVDIKPQKDRIFREEGIISFGSCFSTEIGNKLQNENYTILNNPFGVLYNPASIANSLNLLESEKNFDKGDVILRDTNPTYPERHKKSSGNNDVNGHRPIAPCEGGYTSFYHHGSFTRATPEEFLDNANETLSEARRKYREAKWIIITFGTAFVYRHIEKNIIVSNCHKHPAKEFKREFLSEQEIVDMFSDILKKSDKNWIFTVSPIRHKKDGLHANQISKATLLLAVERLTTLSSNIHYFPSYEIMLDELRDYQYFKENLVNPTDEAVDYIFKRFASSFL